MRRVRRRSPRPPATLGRPLPLMRSVRPPLEWGVMFIVTGPCPGAAAAKAAEIAEDVADDVLGRELIGAAAGRPAKAAAARARGTRPRAALAESLETLEALEARLAVGADLAAVELGALLFV